MPDEILTVAEVAELLKVAAHCGEPGITPNQTRLVIIPSLSQKGGGHMSERRTPLYEIHLRTASKMVKGGGDYMFPLSYTSPLEEHINTRTNIVITSYSIHYTKLYDLPLHPNNAMVKMPVKMMNAPITRTGPSFSFKKYHPASAPSTTLTSRMAPE